MAADASIYAQFRQPVKSVADYMAERDQQESNALKLAAARMDMQKSQQADADTQAIRGLARQHGGDTNALVKALYGGGYLTQAQGLEKSISDSLKARTDQQKVQQDIESKKLEDAHKRINIVGQSSKFIMDNPTLENAIQVTNYLGQYGIIPAEQVQATIAKLQSNPDPESIRGLATQAFQSALDAKEQLPKYFQQNRGGTAAIVGVNPVSGATNDAQVATVTESDAERLKREQALRIAQMVDARAKENAAATRDVAAATREASATTYDSERGVLINRATGLARPAATIDGKPLGPKDKPLPEGAQKQLIGTRNLQDAVDGYQKALEKWGNVKMLSPDARAEMGNAYNNMMLQAKEAYNLGVLNGPDYDILQSVVKDPTKWTSFATSNRAMSDQAANLKKIAANIERRSLEAHGKAPGVPSGGVVGDDPLGLRR